MGWPVQAGSVRRTSPDDNPSVLFTRLLPVMLIVVTALKLITEIALFALCGQWLLGCLTGAGRERNPFYAVLELLGRPWIQVVRWMSPRVVPQRHLPLLAFFLLLLVWGMASIAKVGVCLQIGVALCK